MNKLTPKEFYIKTIEDKGYDYFEIEKKMESLTLKDSDKKIFQIKSAIVFLSRYLSEIDTIINETNSDKESVLIAATVKEERG